MNIADWLFEQLTEQLYRDQDPWNTEWWHAVWHVLRYTPKRQRAKRAFLKLWLDDLQANRQFPACDGLAQLRLNSAI